ncbi:uncharacterized protein EV422DRAFT_366033 [Fimicolochytrium jonesii]|uniref:uncharacterized protein n=1 Tax=Fimicolochytrium jonesii TaxID=1396493 RepID=UPI0022FDC60E|nr:uncharacterized protein EV422DRAFT_366033 [Fimicolochytrium jonesii]KAI8823681.1 hypothetical protein EV422DRAFT_366033 [Fimicolochytrium jonesii]
MCIMDHIGRLKDTILERCFKKKMEMREVNAFDQTMNSGRLCAFFRTEFNRRVDTHRILRNVLVETDFGNTPPDETLRIKPSEQLRREVLEVQQAIENITHPQPALNPPTLLLKHQSELIRRTMREESKLKASFEDGSAGGWRIGSPGRQRTGQPTTSLITGRRVSQTQRRRSDSVWRRTSAGTERGARLDHPAKTRIWEMEEETGVEALGETELSQTLRYTDIEDDDLDKAALASVEAENPVLQGFTGVIGYSRRKDTHEPPLPPRQRYLPPCKYRKRHFTDFDYSKLDAVPLPAEVTDKSTVPSFINRMNDESGDMRPLPSGVSERAPKSIITLAAEPATAVSEFGAENDAENSMMRHVDEKLTRTKEVEELYEEIMRTVKRTHLDPLASEEEERTMCPAAPIEPHIPKPWLWQGLNDPAQIPPMITLATTPLNILNAAAGTGGHGGRGGAQGRIRARDHQQDGKGTSLRTRPSEVARDREAATRNAPQASQYHGPIPYGYGGFMPSTASMTRITRDTTSSSSPKTAGAASADAPTLEEYFNYLRIHKTDFIFDLIYKEDEIAEAKRKAAEEAERLRKAEEEMKRREKERKEREAQRKVMLKYERGEWNPRIIDFMREVHDASGGEPELVDGSEEGPLPAGEQGPNDIQKQNAAEGAVTGTATDSTAQESVPEGTEREQPGTAIPAADLATQPSAPPASQQQQQQQEPAEITPARRPASVDIHKMQSELEHLWVTLKMPLDQKLDMAIKYGDHKFAAKLEMAIGLWKTVSERIISREELMKQIEVFERYASDPERFFVRGAEGSSHARLKESKEREDLLRQLHQLEARIDEVINLIKVELKESVTYEGIPYRVKMRMDYTELIKRLQRERQASRQATSPGASLDPRSS